ncbi:MAG TPA: UDP-N-acetylmuramoylalanyl-D-glutamate--2,6-diaminopimelate ligase [Chitinophagaceae bacterium]|nr:UDP-N-acetylmuramoylalanyl-D-glutamate--2,6-diaminopimelate ligase [Chitinophagaceae bacterium]
MSTEELYRIFLQHPSICTDSRKLRAGDLFFALKGENFNGNHFAVQALESGAAYSIIDEPPSRPGERLVPVNDVLTSLQALAAHHRNQFSIPFIAITGSNGKTTTKELIHAVLSEKYTTYTTEGNLNNHIGIPLTLLKIKKDAEMAIVEMGANHLREIAGYCEYTRPTHGLITNCGKAHLEGFGSMEGIRKGKGELYDYLREHGGTAFVMWDYDYLQEMSKGIREIVSYGTGSADITGVEESAFPHLRVRMTAGVNLDSVQTRLTGNYNLPNVLAAVCVGDFFNVDPRGIKKGIEQYTPSNSRSQLIRSGTNTLVLDAYNANPSSMKLAIENFMHFPAAYKVLLLGAMAELGAGSIGEHEQIIHQIGTYDWKEVILVGGDFLRIKHPYRTFANSEEAGKWLASRSVQHTAILVKGSRSMQMERAVASLMPTA